MDWNYKAIHGAPVVWSDNLFNEEELGTIHKECVTIREKGLLSKEKTGAAIDKGVQLKKNKGAFFEDIYRGQPPPPTIQIYMDKIHNPNFVSKMEDIHPYFRTLQLNEGTSTLLNYYDTSDYYKSHTDKSFVTILLWFYEEPKAFTGGDFVIEDDLTIECKKGRVLFMPGWLKHEVTPVKMWADYQGQGLGRYSISQFVTAR